MEGDTVPVNKESEAVLQTSLELQVVAPDGARQIFPVNRTVAEHLLGGKHLLRFSYMNGEVKFREVGKSGQVYKDGNIVTEGALEVGAVLEVGPYRVRLWDTGEPTAFLKGYSTPYLNAVWPLPPGQHYIGRPGKRQNQILLEHPTVSRAHATITTHEQGNCVLQSESSTNPVYLGGQRLEAGAESQLSHGDLLEVGELTFRFHQPSQQAELEEAVGLEVQSFGSLLVQLGGRAVPDTAWKTRNVKWLFAMLAYAWNQPQSVESLQTRLWPEADTRKARNNFKYTIATLRAGLRDVLPEHLADTKTVLRSSSTVQLNPDLLKAHDVITLQRLLKRINDKTELDTDWETAAMTLILNVRGPFLEDCFDEWAQTIRQTTELQLLDLAKCLLARLESQENWERVIPVGSQIIQLDRFAQWACLALMRALRETGRGSEGLRLFEQSRKVWLEELGLEPQIELLREEQEIRARL
jgi:DNA-binding SARP family transcriptional activator